jgi:hypothetical protein
VLLLSADPKRTPDWGNDLRRFFRIGYYSRQDGLDCIWLVNGRGEYEQTTDRATLLRHFLILRLSSERDVYGDARPPLPALKPNPKSDYAAGKMLV